MLPSTRGIVLYYKTETIFSIYTDMRRDRTDWTDENMKTFTESRKKNELPFVFHGSIRNYNALEGIISCPLHPDVKYTTLWSNFTREDAADNGGCKACSGFGTGKHPKTPMTIWSAKMGVHLSPTFKKQKAKCDWTCVSGDHVFTASYDTMNSVYQRAEVANHDPIFICPHCEIEFIGALHNIEWLGDMTPNISRQNAAKWKCDACEGQFAKSLNNISRTVHPCTNLRCPR